MPEPETLKDEEVFKKLSYCKDKLGKVGGKCSLKSF